MCIRDSEQATSHELGVVNASFLFASARFNTFLVATQCGNKETFETEKAAALDYFVNQYKIALTEHLSVSYTHLDVYKRQLPRLLRGFSMRPEP